MGVSSFQFTREGGKSSQRRKGLPVENNPAVTYLMLTVLNHTSIVSKKLAIVKPTWDVIDMNKEDR